jgi:hypothetical protein
MRVLNLFTPRQQLAPCSHKFFGTTLYANPSGEYLSASTLCANHSAAHVAACSQDVSFTSMYANRSAGHVAGCSQDLLGHSQYANLFTGHVAG